MPLNDINKLEKDIEPKFNKLPSQMKINKQANHLKKKSFKLNSPEILTNVVQTTRKVKN